MQSKSESLLVKIKQTNEKQQEENWVGARLPRVSGKKSILVERLGDFAPRR